MKKIIVMAMIILLSNIVLAAHIYTTDIQIPRTGGVERVTQYDPRIASYRIKAVTHLEPVEQVIGGSGYGRGGYIQKFPRGLARIQSARSQYYPRAQVVITVKDLEESYKIKSLYQGWLYDEDSGYSLNLGVFETRGISGFGILDWSASLYLDEYDYVIVTQEPYLDQDPSPGEAVLIGLIKKQAFYEPEPTFTQKQIGYRFGKGGY